jgi:hypothetical protein
MTVMQAGQRLLVLTAGIWLIVATAWLSHNSASPEKSLAVTAASAAPHSPLLVDASKATTYASIHASAAPVFFVAATVIFLNSSRAWCWPTLQLSPSETLQAKHVRWQI